MTRPRPAPFLVAAAVGVATLTAASAPSPLYPVYQRLWNFSAATLTLVFAVYVLALVVALLTVGSLSDAVGRRPVVSGSLLLLAAGMGLFAAAGSAADLIAARIVQGFAVGAATGAATAMITETAPNARIGSLATSASSPLGIAIGAVLSGALVEFAPLPRQLVFWILGVAYVLLAALVWAVPDRGRAAAGVSLPAVARSLIPDAGVPGGVRPAFVALIPSMVATWALAGLYLSLGTSIVASVLGVRSHFMSSLILGAYFTAGTLGSAGSSLLPASIRGRAGFLSLAAGVLITLLATTSASLPLYLVGSAVAGTGFGATFRAVLGTLADVAPATQRSRVFASMYVVSYGAFSVPALLAGIAVGVVGLRATAIAYGAFEIALIVLAAAIGARGRRAIGGSADARVTADPR